LFFPKNIMANNPIIIISEASEEDVIHLQQYLPKWDCQIAPPIKEDATLSWFPPRAELIIVYAKKEQGETSAICEQFRSTDPAHHRPV